MHMHRFAALLAGGALGGLLYAASTSAPAHADKVTTVGVFGGGHIFSDRNELGVPDTQSPILGTSLKNSVIVGGRFSLLFSNWVGLELEVGFMPTESRTKEAVPESTKVSALTYRGHLIVELWTKPEQKAIPFLVLGGGATSVLSTGDENLISKDTDEMAYVGAGLKFKTDGGLGVRIDARTMFPPSSDSTFETVDFEATLGLFKEFGKRTLKKAPEPVVVAEVPDTDGDGLKDDVDQCKDQPEDADGFQDEDGCPDADNDNDGIADTADGCALDPEDADGFQDDDGCPDPDNDADGIQDSADGCANDPEDVDGFQDEDGCPDPDNDNDGVLDAQDQCPDSLETMNGFKDDDGCSDEVPKAVQNFTGVIKGINFKNDSDVILKTSFKTLDAAVKVLTDYPDLRLDIQGHTDDTGDRDHNMDLSQRRAESVKAYFVGKGVDAARLEAHGYGPDKPLDPAKTKKARAKNRRVEFQLIMKQP